jgi:hypothetical protein
MKYFAMILIVVAVYSLAALSLGNKDFFGYIVLTLILFGSVFIYLEALKNEIIKALSNKTGDNNSDVKG